MATSQALPSYEYPPVVEVSFGVIFSTTAALQTRHLGQFYSRHSGAYPVTEDAVPIFGAADLPARLSAPVPIPIRRVMARTPGGEYLLQIQDTRIYLNWRRPAPGDPYPRYNAVHDRFTAVCEDLSKFAAEQDLGEARAGGFELAYVNQIPVEGALIAEIERSLRPFRFSEIGGDQLSKAEAVNSTWRFAMPGGAGTGAITLNTAEGPQGKQLTLSLACSGSASAEWRMDNWFGAAHEWIVRGFTDLTTEAAQQAWRRTT